MHSTGVPTSLRGDLTRQGWRTGSVVPHLDVQQLSEFLVHPRKNAATVSPDDWLIVVSQTCDIYPAELEAEPFIEVLHCRKIDKTRTQFRDLKSTRQLDFRPCRKTHKELALTAHAVADRYPVPRELFRSITPDPTRHLDSTAVKRVMDWHALRSARPSWPDSFVSRIQIARAALESAVENLREEIAEIRIAIDRADEELGDRESYRISVYFIVDESIWDGDIDTRAEIYAAYAAFVSALANCKGILLDEDTSGPLSGAEFSWQLMQITERWNFANLTHRE